MNANWKRRAVVRRILSTITLSAMFMLAPSVFAEIPWSNSPKKTIDSAQSSGKPILVFVTGDHCHYCKKMKKETWSNPTVEQVVTQNFETLVLDQQTNPTDFRKLQLKGIPATLLYSPKGEFVGMKSGFMPPMAALQWLSSMRR